MTAGRELTHGGDVVGSPGQGHQQRAQEFDALRLEFRYLPSYSPELNDIERTFRKAKHEAMTRRMHPHRQALLAAVHACFRDLRDELASLHSSMPDA